MHELCDGAANCEPHFLPVRLSCRKSVYHTEISVTVIQTKNLLYQCLD